MPLECFSAWKTFPNNLVMQGVKVNERNTVFRPRETKEDVGMGSFVYSMYSRQVMTI